MSYARRFSRHFSTPNIFGIPVLGRVIDADGDIKHLDNGDDAFSGFKTELRDAEVMKLIATIREDDAEKFSNFNFKRLENLTMNVTLTELPVSEANKADNII